MRFNCLTKWPNSIDVLLRILFQLWHQVYALSSVNFKHMQHSQESQGSFK